MSNARQASISYSSSQDPKDSSTNTTLQNASQRTSEKVHPTTPLPSLVPGGTTWVDTWESLDHFLIALTFAKTDSPDLACDCEGNKLGRAPGNITHLTISIRSLNHTWVVCVLILGPSVFRMSGQSGLTLRSVLESPRHLQLWFDLRKDSEALFHHFGIRLGSVWDVQLAENAIRYGSRMHVRGLQTVIEKYGRSFWSAAQVHQWLQDKKDGRELFSSDLKGWKLLEENPLSEKVKQYTAGDTFCLFLLDDVFQQQMHEYVLTTFENDKQHMLSKIILDASKQRVTESWNDVPNSDSLDHGLAPANFRNADERSWVD